MIQCNGHENKRNGLQFKKLLIAKQILLTNKTGDVKRTEGLKKREKIRTMTQLKAKPTIREAK